MPTGCTVDERRDRLADGETTFRAPDRSERNSEAEEVRRCMKCIMPETAAEIPRDGVCSFCRRDAGEVSYRGEAEFRALLDRHKRETRRTGRKYDCMVRVSGGKDSLSALCRLAAEWDVKILAYNYQGAFTDPQAVENLRRAAGHLNVDLAINRDDRIQRRYVARNLRSLLRQPPERLPALCGLLCTGCREGIDYPALALARRHGIKLILSGGCPVEADLQWLVRPRRGAGYRDMMSTPWRFRRLRLGQAATNPFLLHPGYPRNLLRYLALPSPLPYLRKKLAGMENPAFYDYIRYDEDEIIALLRDKVGWGTPEGRSSTKRFDCKLHAVLDALRRKYAGVSEKEVQYSLMIRRGLMTREKALARLSAGALEERAALPGLLRDVLEAAGVAETYDEWMRLLA